MASVFLGGTKRNPERPSVLAVGAADDICICVLLGSGPACCGRHLDLVGRGESGGIGHTQLAPAGVVR